MYFSLGTWDFEIDGKDNAIDNELAYNGTFGPMQPGFLDLIGARLRSGRLFSAADTADAQAVAVINDVLAARFFPGEDPLGQRLRIKGDPDDPYEWMTVVGVIDDIRGDSLDSTGQPAYYAPLAQIMRVADYVPRFHAIGLRTDGDPHALIQPLRRLLAEMDASMPLIAPQTLDEVVAETVAQPRLATALLSMFAVVALVLGVSGIYGVLAHAVAQRTREIGIRKALGARSPQVVTMVLRQGLLPVGVGLAAGAAASVLVGRAMAGLLYGITPLDPATYVVVLATVVAAAVAACLVPALRAVQLDPQVALRGE
jgi:predicted permease